MEYSCLSFYNSQISFFIASCPYPLLFSLIDHDDLWELQDLDKVDNITADFWENYARCNSVLRSMIAVIRPSLLKGAGYMLIYSSCQMGQPLLLRSLVNSIQNQAFDGLYYALALFVITAIASFTNQRHLHHAFRYVFATVTYNKS